MSMVRRRPNAVDNRDEERSDRGAKAPLRARNDPWISYAGPAVMTSDGAASTVAGGSVISLPKGGGAVSGLGETFSPDLFTGTGNVSVPIDLPPGRLGLRPQLALAYSTGNGNGPFGLGWALTLPGVARKTSRGIPQYVDVASAADERADTFLLSGAEDLVRVSEAGQARVRYRPRTEGLFARIEHVRERGSDFWEVRSRDGLLTRYGSPRPQEAPGDWRDPAALADPARPAHVFAWRISQTADPLGNLIRYEYLRDRGEERGHIWDQPLVSRIAYADYGDRADPSFLVRVEFEYEPRPDARSDYRAGFEIRTGLRCRTIRTSTQTADGVVRVVREYRFSYEQAGFNGASLLTRIDVVGIDDQQGAGPATESLPPLAFGYSRFEPDARRFEQLTGAGLPTSPLSDPSLTLADLQGSGLPDIVELGAVKRRWGNRGEGRFELPRRLAEAPPFSLGQAGVRLMDADGDGRPDLVIGDGRRAGFFPMTFAGGWSRRSFQAYRQAPSVGLADPQVRLVDLDGDGLTDVLRSGSRLQCWFNDAEPERAWKRSTLADTPDAGIDLGDPHIRLADMTGDGLQDIVLVRNGSIAYWPNLGYGRWGPRVQMRRAPRLPDGHDPRRLLLGDVDGDGLTDLVYVDRDRVLLWGNQCGNAWSEQPLTISGTPDVSDRDGAQLVDLRGSGTGGLLFSRAADGARAPLLAFLEFTGGVKPHLLETIDNHLGARTTVEYRPSTHFYLRDQANPATRWRTTLPFPVQVVAKVTVADQLSGGRLTTEYRYHHGYWDGFEREFRGFAMVEQLDSETFDRDGAGIHYSPPTLTKSWFHLGPVAASEADGWVELDLRDEYWDGDPPLLERPAEMTALLGKLQPRDRRTAVRALRGSLLRRELYALDASEREPRPYTVTESLSGVREQSRPTDGDPDRQRIFFAFELAQRTSQWERGAEPMTRFGFSAGHDAYGLATRRLTVAVPRGRDPLQADAGASEPYLATYGTSEYARRDDPGHYIVDRLARTSTSEVVNDGRPSVFELRDGLLAATPALPSGASLRVIGHTRTHYDGDAFVGLPLGRLGEHGLPVRTESLAFTDRFLDELHGTNGGDAAPVGPRPVYLDPDGVADWPSEYPDEFRALLPALAGYVHYEDGDVPGSPGGYYISAERQRYDVHDAAATPRGLPLAARDPLGAETRIGYDAHDLLLVRTVDPAGLVTAAEHDYRVLQPRQVTDANGNTTSVTFSPAGLVTAHFVRGKNGEGDAGEPSSRAEYDLLAFSERGRPASVRSIRRVHHDTNTEVPAEQRDEVLVSVEYSDGFGRLLQTRAQAEDTRFGDAAFGGDVIPTNQSEGVGGSTGRTRAPSDPDNVVVSGWQTYDNKGRVVEKYEPFYAAGWDYAEPGEAERGQKATAFYDPRGRVIRTLNPDGSQQRVVFGVPPDLADPDVYEPTPWEAYTYDVNDNAGRTHPQAAAAYKDHWNTPASIVLDALGRTVAAVARNGPAADADWYVTRSAYDIQGNLVRVTDPVKRDAFRYRFDLTKRRWRVESIDAGRRDTVPDALGRPVEARDSKGALTLGAFDALRRPIRVWARDDTAGTVTLRQRIEYGDAGDPDQPAGERAAAREHNLLGRSVRHYDEAGLVTVAAVDFKGNTLDVARRVLADAPILAGYERAANAGWRVTPFHVDWQPAAGQSRPDRDAELLEPTGYATSTEYDALNRVTRHVLPEAVDGRRRELRPTYNRAGGLEQVRLDGTFYLQRIAYDAKGQRTLIAYGNGVMTRYGYDPRTFRLARLRSEHYSLDGEAAYRPRGDPLQDYAYDHDLAGNLLAIHDRTPAGGIPGNPDAFAASDATLGRLLSSGDALDRRFTYDPIYRLLTATGRECDAPPAGAPWTDAPRCSDPTRTRAYTETYRYDAVGSMLGLVHRSDGGFTRDFTLDSTSNRLTSLRIGASTYRYTYDANGNLRTETTSRHFDFDHADRLVAFATQTAGAEPSIHAQYLYDAGGDRVKKLVRKQGGQVEVTHYLGDVFEHRRWPGAGENNRVHVLDGSRRIAIVRIGEPEPGDAAPAARYQLGDHLASSNVVVDGNGNLVNREQYGPYGESTFGSFAKKRYRYTGKERDEESGLYSLGARYYAPWLGRWISCDPLAAVDGLNLYVYARDRPSTLTDPTGTQAEPSSSPVCRQPPLSNVWPPARTTSDPANSSPPEEGAGPLEKVEAAKRAFEVVHSIIEDHEHAGSGAGAAAGENAKGVIRAGGQALEAGSALLGPFFAAKRLADAKGTWKTVAGVALLAGALAAKVHWALRAGGAASSVVYKWTGWLAKNAFRAEIVIVEGPAVYRWAASGHEDRFDDAASWYVRKSSLMRHHDRLAGVVAAWLVTGMALHKKLAQFTGRVEAGAHAVASEAEGDLTRLTRPAVRALGDTADFVGRGILNEIGTPEKRVPGLQGAR